MFNFLFAPLRRLNLAVRRSPRALLILFFLVAALPFLAAILASMSTRPALPSHMIGSLLLPTRPLATVALRGVDGSPASTATVMRGKWTFLVVDDQVCGPRCQLKLVRIRQLRLTQGEDMEQVQRVWLTSQPGDALISTAIADGVRVYHMDGAQLRGLLPSGTEPEARFDRAFYVVDPQGNLVIRYADGLDNHKTIRELRKLIDVARTLG